jgi:hypothetical protein
MKTVTIVYEIVNESEWNKTNPLKYEHNGLKAIGVSIGDALAKLDENETEDNGDLGSKYRECIVWTIPEV